MKPEFVAHVEQRREQLRAELANLEKAGSIVLEIGSGHGHFLVRYATENPAKFCLGVDLRGERIDRAQRKATRARLGNCAFVRAEARELIESLPRSTRFEEVWVLFPDPWPKKRHHKNRLLQPAFLDFIAAWCAPGARLYFRTDHREYFQAARAALAEVRTWRLDPAAAWPCEQETVFQARAPSYESFVAVRTTDPATPAATAG